MVQKRRREGEEVKEWQKQLDCDWSSFLCAQCDVSLCRPTVAGSKRPSRPCWELHVTHGVPAKDERESKANLKNYWGTNAENLE
jgi:hypothetical protein